MPIKPSKSTPELVSVLKKMHLAGRFPSFIDFLRLHSFKNIEDNTEIRFDFPVTALVGANGCGKSSVVQALYGCPEGYSLGKYWFSTKLDPISSETGSRPYLVYGYKNANNKKKEVVKTRIRWNKKEGSSKNMDYWEPSRPLKKLGMKILPDGKRHPAVEKEVTIIDFRYQLSAFDRYFYLEDIERYHAKKRRAKQDVIRLRSEKILQALVPSRNTSRKRADPVVEFTPIQCEIISGILGKNYESGKILHHRFYGFWAHTVVFKAGSKINPLEYTEANAGSGEVAVALLVHKLTQVPQGSLVLLDEPEYSLHPGAQRALLKFLLNICIQKQLQIIFSTHAPSMIEGLPDSAVKVFEQDKFSEKFVVHQDRSIEEAFISIGHKMSLKSTIRVEDALAKELIEEVLKRMIKRGAIPSNFSEIVDVKFFPGGVSTMKQDIAVYARENHKKSFTIFDGTETPTEVVNLDELTTTECTKEILKRLLKKLTKEEIKLAVDGGISGGRDDQYVIAAQEYINYWDTNVSFLPFDAPEDKIWCAEFAKKEISELFDTSEELQEFLDNLETLDSKAKFASLAQVAYNRNNSDQILALQTKFLKRWISNNDDSINKIERLIIKIRGKFSEHTDLQ